MFNFCIFIAYRLRLNLQYIAIFFTNDHFFAKPSTSLSFYVSLHFVNRTASPAF